ncbi:MAG: methionyl-tRNA formyltransferase [Candidatus Brocadiaceae bacterium]|nr:methionyl-tRNA formyltransferase [Candidatus Brocadiaceae bacterium]
MNLAFLGSPDFAVPTLEALHEAGHRVRLVITRPDRPRGRGRKPAATAVKQAAERLGLPLWQPESVNRPETARALAESGAEMGVVAAYGEILRPSVLSALPQGFLNLHASLLPDYRGAAPVHWALMRGETGTGVTVIRMAPRLDAGPVLAAAKVRIGDRETMGELEARLAREGAALMAEVLRRLDRGEAVPERPQPASGGFFARALTKDDGRLAWTVPARELCNRVRGLTPWPGAWTVLETGGRRVKVTLLCAEPAPVPGDGAEAGAAVAPGTVLAVEPDALRVQAGRGAVRVRALKPAGSRAMCVPDFVHGHRVRPGDRFVAPTDGD